MRKQPQPVPLIYQPEPFAEATLHCAESPVRELPIGWGAQKLLWGQKLSPRAGDLMMLRMGWKSQHTGEDKPVGSPDNLFETLPGDPASAGASTIARAIRRCGPSCACGVASYPPRCSSRRPGPRFGGSSGPARLGVTNRPENRFGRGLGTAQVSQLELKNLHVALEDGTEIVKGVDLTIKADEIHAIMGPNGSGKSTLSYAIMGHPAYAITEGQILLDGDDVTEMEADERAQRGLFLAFQYPHAIPGVTVTNFLRTAINSVRKARNGGVEDPVSVKEFRTELLAQMDRLKVSRELASRYLNDGFSGGEKKRVEILQMAMLKPRIAVLDETDSGLDIDALKVVANGVKELVGPGMGALVITHYQRILNYVEPDYVHVFIDGRIVEEGGPELAHKLEAEGYERYEVVA
jgi:Fe-S cluster assembly ATP-binding protein